MGQLGEFKAQPAPAGWEAGTPHVAGIIAWGSALPIRDLATQPEALRYVDALVGELLIHLAGIDGTTCLGPADPTSHHGIVSFSMAGIGPQRATATLDELFGVMVRAGHHCAMPLHQEVLGLARGSIRASLAPYNTLDDVRALAEAVGWILRRRR